jgi:prophage regulatory protein
MQIHLLRAPEVRQLIGSPAKPMPNSTLFAHVRSGTLTPPIKIGVRSTAWLHHEVEAILRARIAGKTTEEIKTLVRELVAARSVAVAVAVAE